MNNIKLEGNTLADWQKVLEELGFEHKYYQYLDCELTNVDWYKGTRHLVTSCYYTDEYVKYLKQLPEGTEYSPDWSQCIVTDISIETEEFGYPEGSYDMEGNWEGHITLSYITAYDNFSSLSVEYLLKALWMVENPISAKNEIAREYIKEVDLFLQKHSQTLNDLDFKEAGDSFLLVGLVNRETEPYLEYTYNNAYCLGDIGFHYNMFTKKLCWIKYVKNEDDPKGWFKPYFRYQLNVNDMTADELRAELIEYLKDSNLIL